MTRRATAKRARNAAQDFYPIPADELVPFLERLGYDEMEVYAGQRIFAKLVSPRERVEVWTTLAPGAPTVWGTGGTTGRKHESIQIRGAFLGRDGTWPHLKDVSGWIPRVEGWAPRLQKKLAEVEAKFAERRAAFLASRAAPPAGGAPPAPSPPLPAGPPPEVRAFAERRGVEPKPMEIAARLRVPASREEMLALDDDGLLALAYSIGRLSKVWQERGDAQWVWEHVRRGWGRGVPADVRRELQRAVDDALGRWGSWLLERLERVAQDAGGGAPPPPEPGQEPTGQAPPRPRPREPLRERPTVQATPDAAAAAAQGLTDEQAAVVAHPGGPALIDAIAGSGKTTTVMRRVLALGLSGQDLARVLVITFTRAAKADMERKWADVAGRASFPGRGPNISTIHGLGYQLVRAAGLHLDADVSDARRGVRAMAPAVEDGLFKDAAVFEDEDRQDVREASEYYAALLPGAPPGTDDLILEAERIAAGPDQPKLKIPPLYFKDAVEGALERNKRISFRGMLERALAMAEGPRGDAITGLFDHVIVDEAQDVSPLQLAVAFRVAGVGRVRSPNLMLVGDAVGQSIYSFQAGRPELVLGFAAIATVYPLSTNFRSTQTIVRAAGLLIDRDERPAPRAEVGEPIRFIPFATPRAEAAAVATMCKQAQGAGFRWNDMCILYRRRLLSALPQLFLMRAKIPHIVERGEVFWTTPAPRLVLGFLRFLLEPSPMGFVKIANKPMRYFPRGLAEAAQSVWAEVGGDVASFLDPEAWPPQFERAVDDFSSDYDALAEAIGSASDAVRAIASFRDRKHARPVADPRPDKGEDEDWTEAWGMLHDAADEHAGDVRSFVALVDEAIRLAKEAERVKDDAVARAAMDAVTLTTSHSSKGREWPYVWVIAFDDHEFPFGRSVAERGEEGEAEERRLAYVAATRAKSVLLLSAAGQGVGGDDGLPGSSSPPGKRKPSPYVKALVDGMPAGPTAPSPHAQAYAEWVAAGAPPGEAPFIVRPKVAR